MPPYFQKSIYHFDHFERNQQSNKKQKTKAKKHIHTLAPPTCDFEYCMYIYYYSFDLNRNRSAKNEISSNNNPTFKNDAGVAGGDFLYLFEISCLFSN